MNRDDKGNLRPGVGTAVIVRKDGKVLFAERLKDPGKNLWHFPGGNIEIGETIENCAAREVKEETNADVKNVKILGLTNDVYPNNSDHFITIFLVCDYDGGEVKDMEPHKARGWNWYEWDRLPSPRMIPVDNFMKLGINPFDNENK